MVGYTTEEKILLRAARLLRDNCYKHEICEECLFNTENCCVINGGVPEFWDLLTEEEEEQ